MGIEDSAILGGLLEKYPSKETLPKALKAYEDIRIKRAAKVATASIESRYFTQMPDGEKQVERDEYLLSHPGIWEGHRNIRSQKEFLDELFGYDAFAELDKYVGNLESAKQKDVGFEGLGKPSLEQVEQVSLKA